MDGGGEGCFPVTKRLKKRSDFMQIYRNGVTRKGTYFVLQILPRPGSNRLGISIPRGWGTAVQRNRIKRLIREVFRRHGEIFTEVDIIVRPHEVCKECRAEEIERFLIEEFYKLVARMEVKHGKGEGLPDERGIHSDAAGA